jgi:hypothetical protein
MEDFNTLLPFYNGDMRERLAALKRSLSSLPQDATNEQLLLYMYGLPTSSILHKLASEKIDESRVMKNQMADSGWEDSTIYSLSELGECPCMSDDGTKVASLFENRHNIRVADLVHPEKSVSITVSEEVFELQCDDEMKHLAVMLKKECFMSKNITILDKDYKKWIAELSSRYRKSQIKAAIKVNTELLKFYWELGRDIVSMKAESRWGGHFMKNLGIDLKKMNPDATCFSPTNLLYMKNFYLLYQSFVEFTPQVGEQLYQTCTKGMGRL